MSKFRDEIKIEDTLTIYVKNTETGEIKTIEVKKRWADMSLWEKILHWTHIKRRSGSLTSTGMNAVAEQYGGHNHGSTYLAINKINYYDGSWTGNSKDCDTSHSLGSSTITFDNEGDAWGATSNCTKVALIYGPALEGNPYQEITLSGTLSISASYTWWCKIELVMS